MTTARAAVRLGVSKDRVKALIAKGKLVAKKDARGRWVIDDVSVARYEPEQISTRIKLLRAIREVQRLVENEL